MTWLGSDDFFLPNAFALVNEAVASTGCSWVTGMPATTRSATSSYSDISYEPSNRSTGYSRFLLAHGLHTNRFFGWVQQEGTFWTRNLWEESHGMSKVSAELAFDCELWSVFARKADLFQVGDVLAVFQRRPGQLSGKRRAYFREVMRIRREAFFRLIRSTESSKLAFELECGPEDMKTDFGIASRGWSPGRTVDFVLRAALNWPMFSKSK